MNLTALYGPILNDLVKVEALISANLQSTRLTSLLEVNQYVLQAPGKRLRPTLCLLAYKSLSKAKNVPNSVIQIASALEMLHMASLIHDDIIDHADIRHNQPTVHRKYGQEIAIPLGVYLYSLSLKEIANAGNFDVLRRISHTVKILCEGEMNQIFERGNIELNLKKYLIILKKKTAILFATACYSGALLSGSTKKEAFILKHVGHCLGMLFQIGDDIQDVIGTDDKLGKKVGQDFEMGELTLPFLLTLEQLPDAEKETVGQLIQSKDKSVFPLLKEKVFQTSALEQSKALAIAYISRAEELLQSLPKSEGTEHFLQLIQTVATRIIPK